VVLRHAKNHPEDHFVFLNTERFGPSRVPPNIHFLPGTPDPREKAKFLATCDAMLHARLHGETFGLAVGEFAVLGKPVITYEGSRERAHLEMLGRNGLTYATDRQLQRRLEDFQPGLVGGSEYETWADAARVMRLFFEKFLA
jgi:glycosyltransferase involved in cell wall biosynthesis